ncbi:XrtA/PEP-CTERM system histidine kinase PrsK [Muricoccus aerilatus]|uniref:XrtA/PEP-CTERM system histidine kinase PrsK n=1 Tax=Muricoccus aerilatus TaxID=452982 RepID=UPI0006935D92|nr:XrtA/PEP-CTERM system histidine kinase PrsK [Roseomonas aerilata]
MTALVSWPLQAACAAVCILVALLVWTTGRRGLTTLLLGGTAAALGAWAGAAALWPMDAPLGGFTGVLELVRAGVWCALLLHLHERDAAETARSRHLLWIGGVVILAVLTLLPSVSTLSWEASTSSVLATPAIVARLGLAVLVVLLAENVYRGADEAGRWHVNLPCIAIGGLGVFDLVLYAEAVLAHRFSPILLDARAVLTILAAGLLLVAALRDRRWRRGPPVSRQAVFHGATLVVSGTFLLGVGAAGQMLEGLGGAWGRTAQASLLAGAVMALAVALSSRSARSRIRRFLVDPFFRARYDYRREWMRCIAALSGPDGQAPAPVRAVRAIADAVDSPAGVLLMREEADGAVPGGLRWSGSWNTPSVPAPDARPLLEALGAGERVLVLSEATPGVDALRGAYGALWLAVPLLHHRHGVLGTVLLAPPRAAFPLDTEVFELLRALGREVAMFLAERQAAERVADGRRLASYAARFAFVAHDVKTVSGGLKLLLGNAEDNISDPEFQRDMLITVRAATARIDTLIARLREPGDALTSADATDPRGSVRDVPDRLRSIARGRGPRVVVECEGSAGGALMRPEAFEAAVGHLLDNAIEASPPGAPVRLRLHGTPEIPLLDIIDEGPGMTADFIRDELFRPLRTARPDGNGIGAWQARELLREAGGELEVHSRPGAGTTMRLRLPTRAATAHPSTPAQAAFA